MDIASDGKIYFSNSSQILAYNIKYSRKMILEMIPPSGLYCCDPETKKVKALINGIYFWKWCSLQNIEFYGIGKKEKRQGKRKFLQITFLAFHTGLAKVNL